MRPPQVPILIEWQLISRMKVDGAVKVPEAAYPPGAAEKWEMGDVYVEFTLGADGVISDARVVLSSGHADLDDRALAGLKADSNITAGKPAGKHVWLLRLDAARCANKGYGDDGYIRISLPVR